MFWGAMMSRPAAKPALILDSVTEFGEDPRGRVGACASHAGRYAAYLAVEAGLSAVILNDAGIGRDRAGVAGLPWLDTLGVPGAAVSHRSARIGMGVDMPRGVLSTVNARAAACGLAPGMGVEDALALLQQANLPPPPAPQKIAEARHDIGAINGIAVMALDSISLVCAEDIGRIVVSASHGGLLGGRPETAVKYPVLAAVYSDADHGLADAGISRLPSLDAQGIAGACVSAFSARIGEAMSTWSDGYISAVNATAAAWGGAIGQSTRAFAEAIAAGHTRKL